jgi:hypothetical protein
MVAAATEATTRTATPVKTATPAAVAATSTLRKSLNRQEKKRSRCDYGENTLERGGFLHFSSPHEPRRR